MSIPEFLLDSFEARKLNNPCVIFFDDDGSEMNEEALLQNYAYVGPNGLDGLSSSAPRKTFYAERYGGVGIGSNGGGARCGTDGQYLVKGMGSNQLLGVDSDFWYGHGTLPLVDAVAEAIWAKILKHALPFGAVDTPAVIATGRMSWTRERGGARKGHPGALLIRAATLRLASFERAIYFKPKWNSDEGFINKPSLEDVQRTRSAINFLPSAMLFDELTKGASSNSSYSDQNEAVIEGLRNIGQRIAMQSAAASAKRIMHGALTGSNIALDSRWMDLGCVTGMNTFGLPASFKPSMWREYRNLHVSICNILYYSLKYNSSCKRMNIRKESIEICNYIDECYERNLRIYILSRCGFPIDIIKDIFYEVEVQRLSESLLDIAQSGTTVDHDRFYEHADRIGLYDFYRICAVLSSGASKERMQIIISKEINSDAKAHKLVTNYHETLSIANFRLKNAEGKLWLNNLINVNCIKSSFVDELFSRNALNNEIENAIEKNGETENLRSNVEEISKRMEKFSRETLADNHGLTSFFGEYNGSDVMFSAKNNSFIMRYKFGYELHSYEELFKNDICGFSNYVSEKFKPFEKIYS
ncbi:hypothetical protein [Sphingobium mellinum]|uniref:hypothetical protein n=1 Tax=Sphingobium mellinum TaxID=1387166 RepID=UPI0030EF10D8